MKLIIGLGNPGEEYVRNRHNVGHLFVDGISNAQLSMTNEVKFFKTDCFMNESGKFVAEKVNFFKINSDDLFIVHDDLDILFGQFKIQMGIGPKVHNGLLSIEQALGTNDFWRIRVGTDGRIRENDQKLGDSGKGYVLDDFTSEEMKKMENLFPRIWEELQEKFL